jgi:NitT/TauT family transport system substrate-binding protein
MRPPNHVWLRVTAALTTVALVAAVAACSPGSAAADASARPGLAAELRLGYFANVTHAPALVGVANGLFAAKLGGTRLSTQVFNAGPAAIESLNAGAIDAAFVGPSPAINAYVKSKGAAVRIVAGSTSGGASLVVRPGISSAADLKGADLASPGLGGTQDVALRTWLSGQGLKSSITGGGDVTITPTENAQTLQLFAAGKIDGAWLPEPWASRLVLEAGGKVLVDETDLWDGGRFPTTELIVSTAYLERHPETVEALVGGTVAAVDWLTANPTTSAGVVTAQIAKLTGAKPLPPAVMARAVRNITFTVDPLAATLPALLADAVAAGTTQKASLAGIGDLSVLNKVLAGQGRPPVSAAGLGRE